MLEPVSSPSHGHVVRLRSSWRLMSATRSRKIHIFKLKSSYFRLSGNQYVFPACFPRFPLPLKPTWASDPMLGALSDNAHCANVLVSLSCPRQDSLRAVNCTSKRQSVPQPLNAEVNDAACAMTAASAMLRIAPSKAFLTTRTGR